MKKINLIIMLMLISISSILFAACGQNQNIVKIVSEDKVEVLMKEGEENLFDISFKVENYHDDVAAHVGLFIDNREKIIDVKNEYLGGGVSKIQFKALDSGLVNVTAKIEGSIQKTVVVNVQKALVDFTINEKKGLAICKGKDSSLILDSEKFINIFPTDAKRDFRYTLKADGDIMGVGLSGNVLTVNELCSLSEVVIVCESLSSEKLISREVTVAIIDKFKRASVNDVFNVPGDVLFFYSDDMTNPVDVHDLEIFGNNPSESQKEIIVRVFATKRVGVSLIEDGGLEVKLVRAYDGGVDVQGNIMFYDFVYSIRYKNVVESGTTKEIDFVVNYLGYDFSQSVEKLKVIYDNVPKQILVNGQTGVVNLDLYNFYEIQSKGLTIDFDIVPASVSGSKSTFSIGSYDGNLKDAFAFLSFYKIVSGEVIEINSGDILSSSDRIFCKTKTATVSGQLSVVFKNVYNENIFTVLNLNIISGANSLELLDNNVLFLQQNDLKNCSGYVYFKIGPANVDLSRVILVGNDKIVFDKIVVERVEADYVLAKVKVSASVEGDSFLEIKTDNGFSVFKQIKVINGLEQMVVDAPSPLESSSVGVREIVNGNLYRTAITLGNSVPLLVSAYPSNAVYDLSFQFFDSANANPDKKLSDYTYSNATSILDIDQLKFYNKLSTLLEGTVFVKATVVPKLAINGEIVFGEPICFYFIVESYVPIKSVVASNTEMELKAFNTVGIFNEHLSKAKLGVSIYPANATFAKNLSWNFDYNSEFYKFNSETGEFKALKKSFGTITVVCNVVEYERKYSVAFRININSEIKIHTITLDEIGDEIYIENSDKKQETYFKVFASSYPLNAGNKNLRYSFLDNNMAESNLLAIDKNGIITIPAGFGISGFIRVAAEDCFDRVNGYFVPVKENNNIVIVPIFIANGATQETAIKISTPEELAAIEMDKHYKISGEIDGSALKGFGELKGGIYGENSDSKIINIPCTLFAGVLLGANIKDISLHFDIKKDIVAEETVCVTKNNYGTISDVLVSGSASGIKTVCSVAINNFGSIFSVISSANLVGAEVFGICKTNNKDIMLTSFEGTIIAGVKASGFVFENKSKIIYCNVLFLQQPNNDPSLSVNAEGAKISGFVGINTGTISNSYVYSYYSVGNAIYVEISAKNAVSSSFVLDNNAGGSINECFSSTGNGGSDDGSNSRVGFVQNNRGSILNCYSTRDFVKNNYESISNCYSNMQDDVLNNCTKCFSGAGANKTLAEWIATGWDISNDFSKEAIWRIKNDGDKPTLSGTTADVAPASFSFNFKEMNERTHIVLENKNLVMFKYETNISPLTQAERIKIQNLNTVNFSKIFSIMAEPFNASCDFSKFAFVSSNTKVIAISGSSFVINGTGSATISVTSRLNTEISESITINVVYPTLSFNIFKGTSSYDPSDIMTTTSKMIIKRGYASHVFSTFNNDIVLTNRKISFKSNSGMKVAYFNNASPAPMGEYEIKYDEVPANSTDPASGWHDGQLDNFSCKLSFDTSAVAADVQNDKVFSEFFTRTFIMRIFQGAEKIELDLGETIIEPIDSLCFDVKIVTDIKPETGSQPFAVSFFGKNDLGKEIDISEHFNVSNSAASENDMGNGFVEYKTSVTVNLKVNGDGLISLPDCSFGNIRVVVSPAKDSAENSFKPATFDMFLKKQSVVRFDYANYYVSSYGTEGEKPVAFKSSLPVSTLAPGKEGILIGSLFPLFAEVDRVEVTSNVVDGFKIGFGLLDKTSTGAFASSNKSYSKITNGLSLPFATLCNGEFFIKTMIPTNITKEFEFQIIIKIYKTALDTAPQTQIVSLLARFVPSAEILINGKKNDVVGRGTKANISISVVSEEEQPEVDLVFANIELPENNNVFHGVNKYLIGSPKSVKLGERSYKWTYDYQIEIGVGFEKEKDCDSKFDAVATVTKVVNGITEVKTTSVEVVVLDFVIESINLNSKNGSSLQGYVGVRTPLDFKFKLSTPLPLMLNDPVENGLIQAIEKSKTEFINGKFHDTAKSLYYVEADGKETGAYVSGNFKPDAAGRMKIVELFRDKNSAEYIRTDIEGVKTGTISMKLKLNFEIGAGKTYNPEFAFDVIISNYTTEDKPKLVNNAEEFLALFDKKNGEAETLDYILVKDIELVSWDANINTSKIKSFDGNNKIITIKSFALPAESGTLNLSLFGTVDAKTTIKNVTVDYGQLGEIAYSNPNAYSSIEAGGICVSNNGIITNCAVVSLLKGGNNLRDCGIILSGEISEQTQVSIGGLAVHNAAGAYITHSFVGGNDVFAKYDDDGIVENKKLKTFVLSGQDDIAGFVCENNGVISNSFFKNGKINNYSILETSQSAGFVLVNGAGGKISGCFSKGLRNNPRLAVSDVEGIVTSGIAAGFACHNFSLISDCYSNLQLFTETNGKCVFGSMSAGFVVYNMPTGKIDRCYSFSSVAPNDLTQTFFAGVDRSGENLNLGGVNFCYYYSLAGIEESYASGAKCLGSGFDLETTFYGFCFSSARSNVDGVWKMTFLGPELISANDIAVGIRRVVVSEETYQLIPVGKFKYGSNLNPILIRSAGEFNGVFAASKDSSVKEFYDPIAKTAFGSYRIICDIDFDELSDSFVGLSTTSVSLVKNDFGDGVIDGNNMTIKNLDISSSAENDSFGMFKSIKNGALVKNINITMKDVSASNSAYVGALSGIVEDSTVVNVSISPAVSDKITFVTGANVVGGIFGVVRGKSYVSNLTASVSVASIFQADLWDYSESYSSGYVNRNVSYAGGVAGSIQTKDLKNLNNTDNTILDFPQANKLKTTGGVIVSGHYAGGIAGYVGVSTFISDALFEIVSSSVSQNIRSVSSTKGSQIVGGYAGGIAGQLCGKLHFGRIEHCDIVKGEKGKSISLQTQIENNVSRYYAGEVAVRGTYENLFSSKDPITAIGGLVGRSCSAMIKACYSKADVINPLADFAGGIIGENSANLAGNSIVEKGTTLEEVFAFGNVASKNNFTYEEVESNKISSGGIIGKNSAKNTIMNIAAINYLDKTTAYVENSKDKTSHKAFNSLIGFDDGRTNRDATTEFNVLTGQISMIKGFYDWKSVNEQSINLTEGSKAFSSGAYVIDGNNKIVLLDDDKTPATGSKKFIHLNNIFPANSKNLGIINGIFALGGQGWHSNFWAKQTDLVFPYLTFGSEQDVFVIDRYKTIEDIQKIKEFPNKIFIIKGNVNLASTEITKFLNNNLKDTTFTGTLKGDEDDDGNDPIITDIKTSLFNNATGATFTGFQIRPTSNKEISLQGSMSSVLVGGMATGCTFSEIAFEKVKVQTSKESFGMVAKEISGKTLFQKVTFQDCSIAENVVGGGFKSVGFLSASASGAVGISDCKIENGTIEAKASSVGFLIGDASGASSVSVSMIESNKNILKNGKITLAQKSGGTNAGLLFGSVQGLGLSKSSVFGQICGTVTGASNIGGIAGKMTGTSNLNDVTLALSVGETGENSNSNLLGDADLFVGGFVGNAVTVSLTNCIFDNTDVFKVLGNGGIELNEGIFASTTAGNLTVGGFVGQGTSVTVKNGICKFPINAINASDKGANTYVGGVVGNAIEKVAIEKVTLDGDVKVSAISSYIGGVVGKAVVKDIKEDFNVSEIVSGRTLENTCAEDAATLLHIGGIVGDVTGKDPKKISNCFVYGDIKFNRQNKEDKEGINLAVGGLAGAFSGTLESNYSLASIKTKTYNDNINALVGSGTVAETANMNFYTNQVSLYVQDDLDKDGKYWAKNLTYKKDINENKSILTKLEKKIKSLNEDEKKSGSKLNPESLTASLQFGLKENSFDKGDWFVLTGDLENVTINTATGTSEYADINIIGDGFTVSGLTSSFITNIGQDSIVSGLNVTTSGSIGNGGVLTSNNKGFVNTCSASGTAVETGLCTTNDGVIAYSSSSVDVTGASTNYIEINGEKCYFEINDDNSINCELGFQTSKTTINILGKDFKVSVSSIWEDWKFKGYIVKMSDFNGGYSSGEMTYLFPQSVVYINVPIPKELKENATGVSAKVVNGNVSVTTKTDETSTMSYPIQSAGSAFVGSNLGLINYSYSSGSSTRGNSFATNFGKIANCYTISRKGYYGTVFNGDVTDCFYDEMGTESGTFGTNGKTSADGKPGKAEATPFTHGDYGEINNCKGLYQNKEKHASGYYNYGYPVLNQSIFGVLSSVTAKDTKLQIPNARMLTKIETIDTLGTYTLLQDIDLKKAGITEWGTIPEFSGTLNGNNKTVSNMEITKKIEKNSIYMMGMFGDFSGAIQNLHLKGVIINSNEVQYAGAFAAQMNSGSISNCTIEDLKITSEANNNANVYIGGAVGKIVGSSETSNVTVRGNIDVVNTSSLVKNLYVGGIAGFNNDDSSAITGCINNATVKAYMSPKTDSSVVDFCVGGIVGKNIDRIITNCKNNASVEAYIPDNVNKGGTWQTVAYVGGIAGYSMVFTSNCTNDGNITFKTTASASVTSYFVPTAIKAAGTGLNCHFSIWRQYKDQNVTIIENRILGKAGSFCGNRQRRSGGGTIRSERMNEFIVFSQWYPVVAGYENKLLIINGEFCFEWNKDKYINFSKASLQKSHKVFNSETNMYQTNPPAMVYDVNSDN